MGKCLDFYIYLKFFILLVYFFYILIYLFWMKVLDIIFFIMSRKGVGFVGIDFCFLIIGVVIWLVGFIWEFYYFGYSDWVKNKYVI